MSGRVIQQARVHSDAALSVVVPMLNEAEVIEQALSMMFDGLSKQVAKVQLIVVDDGSTDNSFECAKKTLATLEGEHHLIRLSRHFGKEQAIAAGLQAALGDVTLIIDADMQHPLSLVTTFLERWADGYDMVYGVQKNRREMWLKRISSAIFYRLMSRLTHVNMPPNAGDFRLMDRVVVDALNRCREHSKFMKGLYAWVGFRSVGVPYVAEPRVAGKSSFHYRRLTRLALTGFITFSDAPLRMWAWFGFLMAGVSFLVGLYVLLDTLIFGVDVPGYATLLISIIFFGGLQLLSVGILGEYISRIFNEVKPRPPYIVKSDETL